MRLGLLLFLGIVFLVPRCTESRTVSKNELEDKLQANDWISSKDERLKDSLISKIISESNRTSQLDTRAVKIFGRRDTTATKPIKTRMTMKTTTITPTTRPTIITKPSKTIQPITTTMPTLTTSPTTTDRPTVNKRRRKRQLSLDEASGSGMGPLEAQHNEEEAQLDEEEAQLDEEEAQLDKEEMKFDEEELLRDDNDFDGEGQVVPGSPKEQSDRKPQWKNWSIGYYGIFQLSDSHFCNSGYRWSRNVCKTNCSAFLDDDISDDIDCLCRSGAWRYYVRHPIYAIY